MNVCYEKRCLAMLSMTERGCLSRLLKIPFYEERLSNGREI